jgi:hypothetical protein
MKVFIANFGAGNWAWKDCLQRSTIAVMDDVRVHPFWQRGDQEGYVAEAMRVLQSKAGTPPIRGVATRWFNVPTIMTETTGDLWIHREKEILWWTHSLDRPATSEVIADPMPRGTQNEIYVYHKLCYPWSNKTKRGGPLLWDALHPKAKEFLFTEGTCQRLKPENALYAQALIDGDDLSSWHAQSDWKAKTDHSGKGAVKVFNPIELTAVRMADTAWQTIAQSGKVSTVIAKDKRAGFMTKQELESYVMELIESQEGLCALTGLAMVLDSFEGDSELRCSLDRIDSNGHYERINLQVVCKFAKRWKGASEDESFRKLIGAVRAGIVG